MRLGFENEWHLTDRFLQQWRFWIVAPKERKHTRISRWDLPENPLAHIIYHAFSHQGADHDHPASDLVEMYDALTGSRLGEALPLPTRDPKRRLRRFNRALDEVLHRALEE